MSQLVNIETYTHATLVGVVKEKMLAKIAAGFVGRCYHCDMSHIVSNGAKIDKKTGGIICLDCQEGYEQ